MVFTFIGACKMLALIDLWLVKAATRFTLFCCALLLAYGFWSTNCSASASIARSSASCSVESASAEAASASTAPSQLQYAERPSASTGTTSPRRL